MYKNVNEFPERSIKKQKIFWELLKSHEILITKMPRIGLVNKIDNFNIEKTY